MLTNDWDASKARFKPKVKTRISCHVTGRVWLTNHRKCRTITIKVEFNIYVKRQCIEGKYPTKTTIIVPSVHRPFMVMITHTTSNNCRLSDD